MKSISNSGKDFDTKDQLNKYKNCLNHPHQILPNHIHAIGI
jgi:hypothetical protein